MLEKDKQQPVFQRREKYFLSLFCRNSLDRIHTDILTGKHLLVPARSSEYRPHSGYKLPWPERLADIIIRSHLQSGHHGKFIVQRRQKNNRNLISGLDLCTGTVTVSLCQRNIQKDQVKFLLFQKSHRFFLPFGVLYFKAFPL